MYARRRHRTRTRTQRQQQHEPTGAEEGEGRRGRREAKDGRKEAESAVIIKRQEADFKRAWVASTADRASPAQFRAPARSSGEQHSPEVSADKPGETNARELFNLCLEVGTCQVVKRAASHGDENVPSTPEPAVRACHRLSTSAAALLCPRGVVKGDTQNSRRWCWTVGCSRYPTAPGPKRPAKLKSLGFDKVAASQASPTEPGMAWRKGARCEDAEVLAPRQ